MVPNNFLDVKVPQLATSRCTLLLVLQFLFFFIITVVLILWWKGTLCAREKDVDLKPLPKEVSYFFNHFQRYRSTWIKHLVSPMFYSFPLVPGTKEWARMEGLFHAVDGNCYTINKAYAIYSPLLVSNAINQRQNMIARIQDNPKLFNNTSWIIKDPDGRRAWTKACFDGRCKLFAWNKNEEIPILPVLHGTDATIAWKICQTGFASLSSLDAGFYGRGIYFTTYGPYLSPYLTKKNPAILICFAIPGNIYPVIENPREKGSLKGSAQKPGFNSHYVLTEKTGLPIQSVGTKYYDELVITQESQVMPAFLITIQKTGLEKLYNKFMREIVDEPIIVPDMEDGQIELNLPSRGDGYSLLPVT